MEILQSDINPHEAKLNELIVAMKKHLQGITPEDLIKDVEPDADSDEVETVYPIASSDEADVAVVRYHGLEPAHKHTGNEWEAHLMAPTDGKNTTAVYVVGGVASVLAPGENVIIPPNTPHFAITDSHEPFTAIVFSAPGFDTEHIVDLEATEPTDARTLALHEQLAHMSIEHVDDVV